MTIRRRILLLGSAGAAVVAVSLLQFYRISVLNAIHSAESRTATRVHDAVQRIDSLAYEYLLYSENRARWQLARQCEELRVQVTDFSRSPDPCRRSIASELKRSEEMLGQLDPLHEVNAVRGTDGVKRGRFLAEQLIISSQEMFAQTRLWQSRMLAARVSLLREAIISAVAASSILLVLLVAGSLLLLRTIVRPIERLRQAVAGVAGGDLTQRVPVDRPDELGVLGADFNQMACALVVAEQQRQRSLEIEARGAALERINRDLEQFAALASHDLQAPLRTITNFTELIQKRAGPQLDERSQNHLQRIIDASDRMRQLIESLLRFSRAGSVDVGLDVDTSCRAALDQALENLSQNLLENEVDLQIADLPEVRFDGIQLIQVFQNLIGNAITYRDRSRRLHIRIWAVHAAASHLTIAVADNGPGIASEQHVRIFGMFNRAHGVEVAGSGIGLALCRKIVEQRGGTIRVESSPGQGATFLFTVPMASGAAHSSVVHSRIVNSTSIVPGQVVSGPTVDR